MHTNIQPVPEYIKKKQIQLEQVKHFITVLTQELEGIKTLLITSTMPSHELHTLWVRQRFLIRGIEAHFKEYNKIKHII